MMKKKIFGKSISVDIDFTHSNLLTDAIGNYPDTNENSTINIKIFINKKMSFNKFKSTNPKVHSSSDTSMSVKVGEHNITWEFVNDAINIYFYYNYPTSIHKKLRKFFGYEYPSLNNNFLQTFYELVLVPTNFFIKDRSLIHASAIKYKSSTILFAGTGGVGKSSSMLSFMDNQDVSFISDDICVVDDKGYIYPNYSWPKVYGYNCSGIDILKSKIFFNSSFLDKLHFSIKNHLDPSSVRRKISPFNLYNSVSGVSTKVDYIIYLFREDVPDLTLTIMDKDVLREANELIINTEYSYFYNHLFWDKYNRILSKNNRHIHNDVYNYSNDYEEFVSNIDPCKVFKLSVPMEINHQYFIDSVIKIVDGLDA
jgi:hypothetical protein